MAQSKFKVGDRVRDEDFGNGTVKYYSGGYFLHYAVEFDKPTNQNVDYCKDGHGLWCDESYLTILTDEPCAP